MYYFIKRDSFHNVDKGRKKCYNYINKLEIYLNFANA